MLEPYFNSLNLFRDYLWVFIGMPAILILGIMLSIRSSFMQVRKFPKVVETFVSLLKPVGKDHQGVHPIGAFFTCLGGCVGIGNVVAICGAIQIGGPGALLWVWIAALFGMMLKYSEVYLGMKYRILTPKGDHEGGPMYFLQRIFKSMWVPNIVAVCLVAYGIEIYQFNIVTNSLALNFGVDYMVATVGLLILVIFTASGGIHRVATVSSAIIPVFIVLYIGMGFWVVVNNLGQFTEAIGLVFQTAFTGTAAIGGFAGSTLMLTISQGVAQGCYSTDVGIGYASIIHSKSTVEKAEKQSCLTIFDIFLDTFVICTMSIFIILVTGVWKENINESLLVQTALAQYFPYMHLFMPFFLFLLGYSTIISFFYVGQKCSEFLSPRYGKIAFYIIATLSFVTFSFVDTRQTFIVMSLVGVILLFINLFGIYRLRDELSFNLDF